MIDLDRARILDRNPRPSGYDDITVGDLLKQLRDDYPDCTLLINKDVIAVCQEK